MTYSREEFERDRMGETGDRLAERPAMTDDPAIPVPRELTEAQKVVRNLKGDNARIAGYLVQRCGDFCYDSERATLIAEFLEAAAEARATALEQEWDELSKPELSCLMCGHTKERSTYSATKGCFICVDCVYQHNEYINMVNLAAQERGRAIQAEATLAVCAQERDACFIEENRLVERVQALEDQVGAAEVLQGTLQQGIEQAITDLTFAANIVGDKPELLTARTCEVVERLAAFLATPKPQSETP